MRTCILLGLILATITLLQVGCGSPATPIPPATFIVSIPTGTQTSRPPTETPTQALPTVTATPSLPASTPTLVYTVLTSTAEVDGVWVAGNNYLHMDPDGTLRMAEALDQLDSQPFAIATYKWDETRLIVTDQAVSGVTSCGDKTGRYELRLLENGHLRIVAINDPCAPRRGDLAREYAPVQEPIP